MKDHEYDYTTREEFNIDSPEKFIWAVKTYEQNISVSRKKGRYLFNKLFDLGQKIISEQVKFDLPKRSR